MANDIDFGLLHERACNNQEYWYIDPITGHKVLTAYFLKNREYCCKSYCRHCPYGFTKERNKKMTFRIVKKQEPFEVKLKWNPSTGYKWVLATKDEFSLLGSKNVTSENTNSPMLVGAAVETIFYLSCKEYGEFNLRFELVRPWEKSSTPAAMYEEMIRAE